MSEVKTLKVGSRKSELALIQTNHVISELQKLHPDHKFEVITMSTMGDKVLDVALSKIGEKALFTKELEIALEHKEVDFVVHSLKDLPTTLPPGMVIGSILEREDPRDAVIMKKGSEYSCLEEMPEKSVIGTSSVRRAAQLKAKFPKFKFEDIRGNLNTRLRKLDAEDGVYAAIILAVAGVSRMGWSERISEHLPSEVCMHAVGQGALGVECREGDEAIISLLSTLHHRETVLRAIAERAFLRKLEGGCSVPVAVQSNITQTGVSLSGGVWSLDGSTNIQDSKTILFDDQNGAKRSKASAFVSIVAENVGEAELVAAERCGLELAEALIAQGAEAILNKAKADNKTN